MNPFDLNIARAYSEPDAFCPRPEIASVFQRAVTSQLWTLLDGDRRVGKSCAVVVNCVQNGWPILHVDLMGVSSEADISERFRWSWRFFRQQEGMGFFSSAKGEVSAGVPGVLAVRLGAEADDPSSWGNVISAFDRRCVAHGGVLFIDELQDVLELPKRLGTRFARSLRATLQMTRHLTPVLAGSSQHLLAPLFDTAAAPFFKNLALCQHVGSLGRAGFVAWASARFAKQQRLLEPAAVDRLIVTGRTAIAESAVIGLK